MTPREFDLALKSLREYRQAHSRELYEVARLGSLLMVNTQIKHPIKDPRKLIKFEWETGVEAQVQTMEQMKNTMLQIAHSHNAALQKKKGK